jgi:hypothetical protein
MFTFKRSKGGMSAMIGAFVVSTLLTSVLGLRQVERFTTTTSWVAKGDIAVGQVINAAMLTQDRVSDDLISSIVTEPRSLLGKTLRASKKKGEPFYPADLGQPDKTWLADIVPEGRVLYTLTPREGGIPHSHLRNGDYIDVLVKTRRGVRTLARDVLLMGALNDKAANVPEARGRSLITALAAAPAPKDDGRNGTPLLIAVYPQDIYPLASIGDNDAVTLVLHGQTEVALGEKLDIDPVTVARRQVEVYNGLARRNVMIKVQDK